LDRARPPILTAFTRPTITILRLLGCAPPAAGARPAAGTGTGSGTTGRTRPPGRGSTAIVVFGWRLAALA